MWTPIGNLVIIKPDVPKETVMPSGLILRSTAQKIPTTATVVAVGGGLRTTRGEVISIAEQLGYDIKPGDRVVYHKFSTIELKEDGEHHLFLDAQDLLCLVDEDDEVMQPAEGLK